MPSITGIVASITITSGTMARRQASVSGSVRYLYHVVPGKLQNGSIHIAAVPNVFNQERSEKPAAERRLRAERALISAFSALLALGVSPALRGDTTARD
jgi:hypothetical protein